MRLFLMFVIAVCAFVPHKTRKAKSLKPKAETFCVIQICSERIKFAIFRMRVCTENIKFTFQRIQVYVRKNLVCVLENKVCVFKNSSLHRTKFVFLNART